MVQTRGKFLDYFYTSRTNLILSWELFFLLGEGGVSVSNLLLFLKQIESDSREAFHITLHFTFEGT